MVLKRSRLLAGERVKRGLTQKDLCAAAGISYDRYMRIENGYTRPEAAEHRRLVEVLNKRGVRLGLTPITEADTGLEVEPAGAKKTRRRRRRSTDESDRAPERVNARAQQSL